MAVYAEVFPDGTPYPVIPLGTTVVNVSSSSGLSSALSSASAGQKIVLADGTYSGDFSMSGRSGNSGAGISVEAANVGGALFASGSTFRVTNCTYVTLSGLMWNWQGEGETLQFRGASSHCRLTRSTFGPTTHTESSASQTWIYVGDDCHTIRIDHNEIRNKGTSGNGVRVYGSFDKVDSGQGSSAGCRRVRIDHNIFRSIKPEVGNDKEPIRYGVSTMSRTVANGVIERNFFSDCICEPELISVKMAGIRTTGNTMVQCAGGPVIRHGTHSVMNDNYVVDRAATFGDTIGSGGIRFYDADHEIAFNYIDGVVGGNFQSPLLLDTGDAEGSSTNLSAHWRVIGALVERNVIVACDEGIRIGDNYSSVPRDCTIRDNLVVDADTGAAITQRVAPSNTVLSNNAYFASTSAAGMTVDADTIARKPGFGPRLTYLTATDVGPAGDLADTDGTGAEVGGGTNPVATPADVLNIGDGDGQNHFQLQYALDGSSGNDWTKAEMSAIAGGLDLDPYFTVIDHSGDTIPGPPAVQFQVRADAGTTSGSSEPRSELRETRSDGSEMAFDAMVGDHSLHTRARITHLAAADPEVVVCQLHNGVTGDRISIRTQLISGETKLLCRINGTEAVRFSEFYAVGTEFEVEMRVLDGGAVEVYFGGSTTPIVTGQLEASGAGASWYWKVGAYAAFNESTVSATEYVSVEHRDLVVTHSAPRVDAGVDAQVVAGLSFTRSALELGLTGITRRSWTIVSQPVPDTGNPDPGDQTVAAIRHGWGTPLPQSDEFNYTGTPNPSKWKLPGESWAGHAGNGTRDPERVTVDGEKLVMSGLANGSTGWMEHQFGQQYGRWEARVRSYQVGSSGSDYHALLLLWPDSNSRQDDGEYDWMELGEPGDSKLSAFIHYPHPGTEVVQQEYFERPNTDMSQWHNVGMEWTSQHIKGFIDGQEWFSVSGGANDVRRNIQDMPSGHGTIQLDGFHGDSGYREARIEVDWYRVYSL